MPAARVLGITHVCDMWRVCVSRSGAPAVAAPRLCARSALHAHRPHIASPAISLAMRPGGSGYNLQSKGSKCASAHGDAAWSMETPRYDRGPRPGGDAPLSCLHSTRTGRRHDSRASRLSLWGARARPRHVTRSDSSSTTSMSGKLESVWGDRNPAVRAESFNTNL